MTESPPRAIADRIDRLARLLRARAQVSGLNPAQWAALRYLSRANRFSRTPGAVTRYLGATKGTVSQTLIALERKGLLTRQRSSRDRRSVSLALTDRGQSFIRRDPLQDVEAAAAMLGAEAVELGGKLGALLEAMAELSETVAFGSCGSCQRRDGVRCRQFRASLSEEDFDLLCVAYSPEAGS
ncbi:MAG: MarR family transcriptional regulator [Rhodobiaceae bacterium]|nr:MarR family transcriptional regulator [Rhodobiaceae bacterium]MCC0055309.1 MarR family transcriptional regulator [Rhodobiaceae bacterium]